MEPTVGRTDYQNEVAVINGQDIPTISYYDMAGLGYFPACSTRKPAKLIDGSAERKAAWQLYRSGRLTLRQWLADWRGRKRFMRFRINDPMPFLVLTYLESRWFAGRVVRFILRKSQ
jgi:predicted ATP-grasp superfamily ATP-dependent carboligase